MGNTNIFDYYYGIEAEQFSFYRVPRLLIKDARFKSLSSDAKLLYGLMLDRMSLSMKNGWLDDENRAYIIYTIDAIMEDLGCAKATCVKIMKELDSDNGIGLIEKKRRGLGKPDIIYVKNFSSMEDNQLEEIAENADKNTEVQDLKFKKSKNDTSRSSEIELQEVQNLNFKKSKNYTSESSEIELQEVQNLNPNYTNISYTDNSYTESINQSILPSGHLPSDSGEGQDASMGEKMIDGIDWIEDINADTVKKIKENIDYDYHIRYDEWRNKALFNELYEIICEIVCIPRETVRIEGRDYPYGLVRKRFLELTGDHVEYVIGCMHGVTSRISNIKSYMVTALFNAPATIDHYYQQEVQYDYGLSAEKEAWAE